VLDAWIEDEHGVRQGALAQGHACAVRAAIGVEQPLEDPMVAIAVVNAQHQNVFVASCSHARGERSGHFDAGETFDFSVSFENALAPGRYAVSMLVSHPGGQIADRWESIFTFVVSGAGAGGGLVDLPHDVRIESRGRVPGGELRA
jgi:hypothetical protein